MKLNVIKCNNFLDTNSGQIDLIGKLLTEGREQVVIVPDKYVLCQKKRIMDRLNWGATFNVKVMSISSLADMVLGEENDRKRLTKFGATMVVEMLIIKNQDRLVCFNKTLVTVSFAESVYTAIMRLKSCGISPKNLRAILDKMDSDSLRKKVQDILLVYEEYEHYKSDKYYDTYDRLSDLSEAILGGKLSQKDFHFCNFESMSLVEFGVLESVIKTANSVSVGVVVSEEGQPNEDLIKSDIWCKIDEFCVNFGVKPNIFSVKSERAEFTQHMLCNALAVVPVKMELAGERAEIYEASNPRLEVEFVALDILQRVRKGARFRDFEVNCADLRAYEPILRNTFSAMKIPFWIDSPTPFEATEMGKLIFAVLDFAYDGLQAKDLYRFISNGLSNFTQSERELFESVTTCYGITGENLINPPKLKNIDANYEKYLQINQKLAPLYEFCGVVSTTSTVVNFSTALKKLLEKYDVAQNLSGLSQALLEDGCTQQSGIARQNYKKFESILDTMGSPLGEFECGFAEFNKILRRAVATVTINPQPISLDCVRIGQSGASVFEEVKFYYIMCAIEGKLPSFSSDVGLITDYDIDCLKKIGLNITPSVREINSLRRQGVIDNLSYAKERVCITYPISIGKEGCSVASLVTSITSMFTYNSRKLTPINLNFFWDIDLNPAVCEYIVDQKYATKNQVLRDYIAGLNCVDMSNERKALQNSLYEILAKFDPKMLKNVEKWRQKPKKIPNLHNTSEVFFTGDKAGVTQIEKYFDCPYAHFLTYGVKVKERKTATMQATDIGTLLHAVLEAFGRKLASDGVQNIGDIPKFVCAVFDKLLCRPEFENFALNEGNLAQLSALRAESVRACEAINYQMQHSRYRIKFIESKFGTEGFVPVPEVVILNTNKRVKISGKIDRADVCDMKLRIIDYKTSKNSAEFKLLNFYLGKKIQLFYYMAVMLKTLKYQPSGAYYLPVHKEYSEGEVISQYSGFCMQGLPLDDSADLLCQDDQLSYEHHKSDITGVTISMKKEIVKRGEIALKSKGATEMQFALMLKYAEEVLSGAVQDIYSGYIEPSHFKTSCEYCKFKNICRAGVLVEDKIRTDKFDVENTAIFASKTKKELD